MVGFARQYLLRFNTWFSGRLPALSSRFSQAYQAYPNQVRFGLFFLIAWGGAYGAHQVSQQSAIAGWHQLHFPSSQMMNLLLEQYQMVHVSDVTLQQRVGRFLADLPAYWQGEQFPRTVWANADLTWVVYDLGWTEGADFEVFRWSETDLSIPLAETGNWKLMGPGWDGLDRVLDRLEKKRERDQIGIERKTPGSPNAKERRILPKSPWRDPREILY